MNAKTSAFVWPRTGWLFLGGRAPLAGAHARARATAAGGSHVAAPRGPRPRASPAAAAHARRLPSAGRTATGKHRRRLLAMARSPVSTQLRGRPAGQRHDERLQVRARRQWALGTIVLICGRKLRPMLRERLQLALVD